MSIIRQALTDEKGVGDVAYVSLFIVCGGVLGAAVMMVFGAAAEFAFAQTCLPLNVTNAAGVVAQKLVCYRPHAFNVQPLGIGIGAVCTGFGVALGALAGYMAATRPPRSSVTQTTTTTATAVAPAPAREPS